MPQVNAAQLYVSLEALADNTTEVVQQTTTALQFTTLDNGCTTMGGCTMGGYTMGGYPLPSQDHVANTSETLYPQETHLEEEDEDHAANDGENVDDVDEYEKRIKQGDFENDVDDHEVVPNFEEEIWSTMMKVMQMMILASSMIQMRPLPTHLLPSHSTQILGKIWLILHVF